MSKIISQISKEGKDFVSVSVNKVVSEEKEYEVSFLRERKTKLEERVKETQKYLTEQESELSDIISILNELDGKSS